MCMCNFLHVHVYNYLRTPHCEGTISYGREKVYFKVCKMIARVLKKCAKQYTPIDINLPRLVATPAFHNVTNRNAMP